jgi:hypothetical protein
MTESVTRRTKVYEALLGQVDGRSWRRIRAAWGAPRCNRGEMQKWIRKESRADLPGLLPFLRVPQLRSALDSLGFQVEGMQRAELVLMAALDLAKEVVERWPDCEEAEIYREFLEDFCSDCDERETCDGILDCGDAPGDVESGLRRALERADCDPEIPLADIQRKVHGWSRRDLSDLVQEAKQLAEKPGMDMCEWFLLCAQKKMTASGE